MRLLQHKAALAIIAGLALVGSIVPAGFGASDDAFRTAHWAASRFPFELRVGDNAGTGWDSLLRRAADQWSKKGVVEMRIASGGAGDPRNCAPTNGRVEVCSAKYGENGNLGLTRLLIDGNNHIKWAVVKLNDSYFEQRNGEFNSKTARIHTACHEVGHALGLPHASNKSESCLNDSVKRLEQTLEPARDGYKALARRYDHKDNDRDTRIAAEGSPASVADVPVDAGLPTEVDPRIDDDQEVSEVVLPDGSRLVTIETKAVK